MQVLTSEGRKVSIMERQRLLVIGDDAVLIRLLERNLGARGYEIVSVCLSDPDLEAEVDSGFPSVAVLDITMLSMYGIGLCLHLRRRYEIPTILLSTWGAGEDRVRGLGLTSDDCVTTPSDGTELTALIEEAFKPSRASRDQSWGIAS